MAEKGSAVATPQCRRRRFPCTSHAALTTPSFLWCYRLEIGSRWIPHTAPMSWCLWPFSQTEAQQNTALLSRGETFKGFKDTARPQVAQSVAQEVSTPQPSRSDSAATLPRHPALELCRSNARRDGWRHSRRDERAASAGLHANRRLHPARSKRVHAYGDQGRGPRGRNNLTSAARLASKMSMKCWLARLKLSKYSLTSRGSSTRASTRYISFSNALKTGERSARSDAMTTWAGRPGTRPSLDFDGAFQQS